MEDKMKKAELIKALIEKLDPNLKCEIVEQPSGGVFVCGPFPTFIITIGVPDQEDGYLVSVNADAPTATYFILELVKEYPELIHWGAFAEALDNSGAIYVGPEAYTMREQHVVANAMHIIKQRDLLNTKAGKDGLIVPEEKKLILPPGN